MLSKYAIIVFLSLLSYVGNAQPVKSVELDLCELEENALSTQEKIVYEIYYNWKFIWVPAGEVEFIVKEKDQFIEISAIGITYDAYDSFYKVRDTFVTRIDRTSLKPKLFSRRIHESNYHLKNDIVFDQKNQLASSSLVTKHKNATQTFEFDGCMHDLLSILYSIRNFDFDQLNANENFRVKLLLDHEVYDLNVLYAGKEKRKKIKGLGKYRSLKFSMSMDEGHIFKDGDEMHIWVADDKNKLALLIESPISVGSIKAVLKSYSGLAHNFDSKVK